MKTTQVRSLSHIYHVFHLTQIITFNILQAVHSTRLLFMIKKYLFLQSLNVAVLNSHHQVREYKKDDG